MFEVMLFVIVIKFREFVQYPTVYKKPDWSADQQQSADLTTSPR